MAPYYLPQGLLPILWRRKGLILGAILLACIISFLVYASTGVRYESYALLRVGHGIRDSAANAAPGPFGEGADLSSRMESLARIAITDHAIMEAANNTGLDLLYRTGSNTLLDAARPKAKGWLRLAAKKFDFLPIQLDPGIPESQGAREAALVQALRGMISAKQDGRSDLLRISFRYPDANVAARFITELSYALVAIQADLTQVPGADVFFEKQARRLETEAEQAATDLQNFSVKAAIYSVTEQRGLLLKRANDLESLIASTRAQIEEKKGQKQALVDQLLVLRPISASKTVTGIVNNLGKHTYPLTPNEAGNVPDFVETPPLLLVRVYQDAVASLLKVNSDLNGSLQFEAQLKSELADVSADLAALSSKEAQYEQLKRVLTRASVAADQYGTRVIEEKITRDIANQTQLSSVRIIQAANQPFEPVFPNRTHFVLLALIGGLAAGSLGAVMLELARLRQAQLDTDELVAAQKTGPQSVRQIRTALQSAE